MYYYLWDEAGCSKPCIERRTDCLCRSVLPVADEQIYTQWPRASTSELDERGCPRCITFSQLTTRSDGRLTADLLAEGLASVIASAYGRAFDSSSMSDLPGLLVVHHWWAIVDAYKFVGPNCLHLVHSNVVLASEGSPLAAPCAILAIS